MTELRKKKVQNASGTVINPSTEEKQNTQLIEQQSIECLLREILEVNKELLEKFKKVMEIL